jgi:hypothetical protein
MWKSQKEKRDAFSFPFSGNSNVIPVDITFNSFVRSQMIRQFPKLTKDVKQVGNNTDLFHLKIKVYDIAPIGRFIFGLINRIAIHNNILNYKLKEYYNEYIKGGIEDFVV